jgi:hypothetical protein
MNQAWSEIDEHEQWSLQADELRLPPGMTDKGRLGCALQLKFRQIHGRYPERLDEIDPTAARSVAEQVGVSVSTLSTYDLDSRQGQRHRCTIRNFLGYRLATGVDLQELAQWLCDNVLPFDPQARHGRDQALDWCRTQHLEPPALDHLERVIRSSF